MINKIIETGRNKYGILSEFEVGNSGHYEQRVIISGVSKKKVEELIRGLEIF